MTDLPQRIKKENSRDPSELTRSGYEENKRWTGREWERERGSSPRKIGRRRSERGQKRVSRNRYGGLVPVANLYTGNW